MSTDDIVRANFVETNLELHEMRKQLLEMQAMITDIFKAVVPEEKTEDNKPIEYPKD